MSSTTQLSCPGLIARGEVCFFRDFVKTDSKACDYETDIKEKQHFIYLAQEQRTVKSDDVILVEHEISKPCYFMPVYTHAL